MNELTESEVLLELVDVHKVYRRRPHIFDTATISREAAIRAVNGVSLRVQRGEILGLVGESGSGKSTVGEIMLGLIRPSSGSVHWEQRDLRNLRGEEWKEFRRGAQMVFQDPYASLNPRMTIFQSVAEPAIVAGVRNKSSRLEAVTTALERCGLAVSSHMLDRYPHQISGGQRQRVAIARAIVMEPLFLVADEPVSMLDASIQSGVLSLLLSLRDELNLTIVYISHDLATVQYLCDNIAVMNTGAIVEAGPTNMVVERPDHAYTRQLLDAIPGEHTRRVALEDVE